MINWSNELKNILEELKTNGFIEKIRNASEERENIKLIKAIEPFGRFLSKSYVSSSSIRNIYETFKAIEAKENQEYMIVEEKITSSEERLAIAFDKIYPQILLLRGKINYILERKIQKLSENNVNTNRIEIQAYKELKQFLLVSIDNINSHKEFKVFLNIFECVIGFMKQ